MRLKNLDLIVTVVIAALNVTWALLPIDVSVMRIILSLPLIFVLPGYTLSEALFHKRSRNASERILFSLGLSLAIDILSGLFLNILPVGLQARSWTTLLGLLTLVFSLLAAFLRRGVPVSGARPLRGRFGIYPGILFGLAIVVAILSVAYAAFGATHQQYPGFTQLWILPEISTGKSCAVRLGVRSFESTSERYRLTMTANGDSIEAWPALTLGPQQEWFHLVPITPGIAKNIIVKAQLYRLDKPEAVYRTVNLTLYSCPTSQVAPTSHPSLASAYNGTIHDIPANITTTMSLTSIQQSGRNITGHFTAGAGLLRDGSLRGNDVSTQDIQFTVTDHTGHAVLSFDGALESDGTFVGTYCNLGQRGQCRGDYGIWSLTPKST